MSLHFLWISNKESTRTKGHVLGKRSPLSLINIIQISYRFKDSKITHFPEVQEVGDKAPDFILLNHKFRVQVQIIRRNDLQEKIVYIIMDPNNTGTLFETSNFTSLGFKLKL